MSGVRTLRDLPGDRRGGVTMITAGSMVTLMGMLALAVDVGSVFLDSRRLQGVADSAALAAVTTGGNGRSAADAMIGRSGWSRPYSLAYNDGSYTPDLARTPTTRFSADSGAGSARLSITSTTPLFFASALLGRRQVQITRSATATRVNAAAFSIGTRLAAVNGGLPNQLLSALAGTSLNLSVADSNALLGAKVDVLTTIEKLNLRLNARAGTFNEVLATNATMPQLISAMSDTLLAQGDRVAATVLEGMSAKLGNVASVKLGDLVNLGSNGNTDHASPTTQVKVNAFDFVRTLLETANGARQAQLDTGVNLPGLLSTSVFVATGQRNTSSPWLTVTNSNQTIIRSAQSRVYVKTTIGASSALSALGVGGITLPLYTELAQASAKLSSISCSRATGNSVTLDVQPAIGHVSITEVDPTLLNDFTRTLTEAPATLVRLPLVSVTGQARVDLGGATWQSAAFNATDISNGTVRTVSTNDTTTALASSLVNRTTLNANVLGLGLNVSLLTSLIGSQLQLLAPTLDGLLNSVTDLLGVHLGQADVSVNGVRCGIPALVA